MRSKILVFSCNSISASSIYPFISFMAPKKFKFLDISRPFFEIKPELELSIHYIIC